MIAVFALWLPIPEAGIRVSDLEHRLADALSGRPLRWAVTACEADRLLIEGAVIR